MIAGWLHKTDLDVTHVSLPPQSPSTFEYSVSSRSGPTIVPVLVAQVKEMPSLILLHTVLALSQRQKCLWRAARPEQTSRVAIALRMELSRCHIKHQVDLPNTVAVRREIIIAPSLTDVIFLEHLDDFMADVIVAHDWLALELDGLSRGTAGDKDGPAPPPP
jgi:hypothetical protein